MWANQLGDDLVHAKACQTACPPGGRRVLKRGIGPSPGEFFSGYGGYKHRLRRKLPTAIGHGSGGLVYIEFYCGGGETALEIELVLHTEIKGILEDAGGAKPRGDAGNLVHAVVGLFETHRGAIGKMHVRLFLGGVHVQVTSKGEGRDLFILVRSAVSQAVQQGLAKLQARVKIYRNDSHVLTLLGPKYRHIAHDEGS